MSWRIIKSEIDYDTAMNRLNEIFQPRSADEQDEFDLLVLLITTYEAATYHIEEADPIQVFKTKMDYMNLQQKDMVKYIGSKATVSKILSYKSPLTLKHVWILSKILNLPIDLIARPYKLENWNIMKKFEDLDLAGV